VTVLAQPVVAQFTVRALGDVPVDRVCLADGSVTAMDELAMRMPCCGARRATSGLFVGYDIIAFVVVWLLECVKLWISAMTRAEKVLS
jgi:hypothetical protein